MGLFSSNCGGRGNDWSILWIVLILILFCGCGSGNNNGNSCCVSNPCCD